MRILILILLLICTKSAYAEPGKVIPRTIITFYSKAYDYDRIRQSLPHLFAEMPLNHLGLKLEYHRFEDGLPQIAEREDVRGVLTWFNEGMIMKDPEAYLAWAKQVIKSDKKFVVLGEPGFYQNTALVDTDQKVINSFWEELGIEDSGKIVKITYDSKYAYKDPKMTEYERQLPKIISHYPMIDKIDIKTESHLIMHKAGNVEQESHLIATNGKGGFVADGYSISRTLLENDKEIRFWYINPFEFFRRSFATDNLPKADTTTIAGRRIYYSHIDGDGWNNITRLEMFKKKNIISAAVIMDRAIKPYSDLPVSIGPIAADIDKDWNATEDSIKVAKELLNLPHVEAASHTYSHPFNWKFFADGIPEKERSFLSRYHGKTWESTSLWARIKRVFVFGTKGSEYNLEKLSKDDTIDYDIPRAYAAEKFSIDKEIGGSIATINTMLADDKKANIIFWSGNTEPFEQALLLTSKANVLNINGGDSRFDREYPSISWVAPIGRQVGKKRQIYASSSNENTYTELWTSRFYGFKYLIRTVEKTDSPMRLKPFNIYYHMYSGEREASLAALIDNLEYARKTNITPIAASNYAAIANGFYSSEIAQLDSNSWQVSNRGSLQTIRFDNQLFAVPDMVESQGVVGFNKYQGSLYVYLDAAVEQPIIKLKPTATYEVLARDRVAYLIESRWPIWDLKKSKNSLTFLTQGFGTGDMLWSVPQDGTYSLSIAGKVIGKFTSQNGKLRVPLEDTVNTLLEVTIKHDKAS